MKSTLKRIQWILSTQVGINPIIFLRSLRGIPRFIRDFMNFRSSYSGRLELVPCLHDWHEEGGVTKSEYFWQDLLVARMIFQAQPDKHIDIGSRVDGFVAHVASFREIEVFDIRPISTQIPGIKFKKSDLMKSIKESENYCDSLSCLHALEHFGLGRYGDPIDINGAAHGLRSMSNLLKNDGVLYLSIPIGIDRVEFNANRVFDPNIIINLALKNSLTLSSLIIINQNGEIKEIATSSAARLNNLANQRYNLGIFTFVKVMMNSHNEQ